VSGALTLFFAIPWIIYPQRIYVKDRFQPSTMPRP
jgi:hypothetical protein